MDSIGYYSASIISPLFIQHHHIKELYQYNSLSFSLKVFAKVELSIDSEFWKRLKKTPLQYALII